jgi:hypothetical protein
MSVYRTNFRTQEKLPRDWSWLIKATVYIGVGLFVLGMNALLACGFQFVIGGFFGVKATFWHYYVALCMWTFYNACRHASKGIQ